MTAQQYATMHDDFRSVLEQHPEQVPLLFDNASDGLVLLDLKGWILDINTTGYTRLGYSKEEMVGQHISRFNAPEFNDKVPLRFKEVAEKGSAIFETCHLRRDGTPMPIEINARLVELGGVKRVFSILRDVTERKKFDEELRLRESRYRGVVETAPDGFWMADMRGRLIEVNDAYVRQSGYSRDELLGMTISELDALETPEMTAARVAEIIRHGHAQFETMHRARDGRLWPVEVTTTFWDSEGGRFFVFLKDISERRKAEESMRLASLIYQTSKEAILVTDAENRIVEVNPAFTEQTGFTFDDVRGMNPRMFKSGHHEAAFYEDMWRAINEEGHWKGELWDRRKDGSLHIKLCNISAIRDAGGGIYRYVAQFHDITDAKQKEELIWQQANLDSLTGLPNRRLFLDRLQQEMKKAHRTAGRLALLFIDLDRFKEVNDTLGHVLGDQLLIEAASRIKSCMREADTVARLGGDEFAVILAELSDTASIEHVAQHLIDRLAEPFVLDAHEAYISASIGISLYPDDTPDLDNLLKNADQAMYAAKGDGRNQFHYFTPDMQEEAQSRLRVANDLRVALAREQFILHYQPIVHLASGKVHKAEALIRWEHPQRGIIGPADFIAMAEETGLIVPIGDWVFREAVRQVAKWRASVHPGFQVSVNKSPVQLRQDPGDRMPWPQVLAQHGLPGDAVVAEITEGMLLNTEERVNAKLLDFSAAGIQVAIDDFGTGYSSLAYLKKLDIDYLKIDRSFVRGLDSNTDDLAMCEAIVVMAHKLGLQVIAEGVETETQRALLRGIGCDYAQGYLFSRPVAAGDFERLLAGWTHGQS